MINTKKSNYNFSYSQLNTFKICPQQYKIIYINGVRKVDESIEAFMGKRVHEVLEWLYSELNIHPPHERDSQDTKSMRHSNKRCSNQRLKKSGYTFVFSDYKTGISSLF